MRLILGFCRGCLLEHGPENLQETYCRYDRLAIIHVTGRTCQERKESLLEDATRTPRIAIGLAVPSLLKLHDARSSSLNTRQGRLAETLDLRETI